MKIGLVRHFEVSQAYPSQRVGKEEVWRWFAEYDRADIVVKEVDLGPTAWEICYSSDTVRAIRTAREIYKGDIVETRQLREIPLPPFSANLKLPFLWWAVAVRLKQLTTPTGREQMEHARRRIRSLLDQVAAEEQHSRVLFVSHGALMKEMRNELRNRGFKGPRFSFPENGKLYVFEK